MNGREKVLAAIVSSKKRKQTLQFESEAETSRKKGFITSQCKIIVINQFFFSIY